MIINSKSGCIISGYIVGDADTREAGNGRVTKFGVRYDSEPPEQGQRYGKGKVLNVEAWGSLSDALEMVSKGDYILAVGQIQSHEYNGQTYHSLRAESAYLDVRSGNQPSIAAPAPAQADFAVIEGGDDDLPF